MLGTMLFDVVAVGILVQLYFDMYWVHCCLFLCRVVVLSLSPVLGLLCYFSCPALHCIRNKKEGKEKGRIFQHGTKNEDRFALHLFSSFAEVKTQTSCANLAVYLNIYT